MNSLEQDTSTGVSIVGSGEIESRKPYLVKEARTISKASRESHEKKTRKKEN